MKLSRYEQETVVNYNAGEQTATLYTRDKAVVRKLDTLVLETLDEYQKSQLHMEFGEFVYSIRVDRACIDYEI